MLRVMHIIGTKEMGGAESFFLRLTSELRKHIQIQTVVRKGSWLEKRLIEHDIPFEALPFGGRFDFFTRNKIRSLLTKYEPDIVQTWMSRASSFMPATSIPTIARLGGYYDPKHFKSSDFLVGNSRSVCTHLNKFNIDAARIFYISNFVSEPILDYSGNRQVVREKFGISKDAKVILLAGRFHPVKGFDIAIKALSLMPSNVFLLIAGEGEQERELKQLVRLKALSERVKFTGWVNSISPLCAASDIFLVPSRQEPLGNVVLDAWAHSLPVVATTTDGPRELIVHRQNGILIPIGDEVATSQALNMLLNDPDIMRQIAASGRQKVLENYSKEKIVGQYLNLYFGITKGKNRN